MFNNLRLGTKIIVGFLAVVTLVAVAGVTGYCGIQRVGQALYIITDEESPIVDSVEEVLNIKAENIEDVPEFGSSVNTNFIIGIGKVGKSVKILLDIDKILTSAEAGSLGCCESISPENS